MDFPIFGFPDSNLFRMLGFPAANRKYFEICVAIINQRATILNPYETQTSPAPPPLRPPAQHRHDAIHADVTGSSYRQAVQQIILHREMSRGGKREGAGRKSGPSTATHPVRCTDEGWEWLQSQALGKGHTSVGKWADAAGRKARRTK